MVGNDDHPFFVKEVRSHVRTASTEYLLLCECIRRLHVALATFLISNLLESLCHGCALHSTPWFFVPQPVGGNPSPCRGATRGFFV